MTDVLIVNDGSIRIPVRAPLDAPLPGAEVVSVNLARELASAGLKVTYATGVDEGTWEDVRFVPVSAAAGQRPRAVLWVRDYFRADDAFDAFSGARHVLLTGDSSTDLTFVLKQPKPAIGAHLARYLERFDGIGFASDWHLREWRSAFDLPISRGLGVLNLATHLEPVTSFRPRPLRAVHTGHPRKALVAVARISEALVAKGQPRVTCLSSPALYQDPTCQVGWFEDQRRFASFGSFKAFCDDHAEVLDFRPPVPPSQIGALLDDYGVLLHPDYSEETGATTVIEGVLRGLVPVVTTLGVLPELVADGGIVLEGSSKEDAFAERCADAMSALTERDQREYFERQAALRERFAPSRIVGQWRELLGC